MSQLNLFDISNTTGKPYRNFRPPDARVLTLPVALIYEPKFEAVTSSIDMNLPYDNINDYTNFKSQRLVRLQMFVNGPYKGYIGGHLFIR